MVLGLLLVAMAYLVVGGRSRTDTVRNQEMVLLGVDEQNGLVTNEWAYWNPTDSSGVKSRFWQATSGSLFARNGDGWTGSPDSVNPDRLSSRGNNSAIFRLVSHDRFSDVTVSVRILNVGLLTTSRTPSQEYDGIHIFLRYQSQYDLYYASINRRDNTVVIKKKVAGGLSNGGTYFDLTAYRPEKVAYGTWQTYSARVVNLASGAVELSLWHGSELLTRAIDDGIGGVPPYRGAGSVGLRGDNCEFFFRDFTVTPVEPDSGYP